jgi:hypothetical protein
MVEAIRLDDINYSVWREIYITNMVSSLVLNLISPSFSFINNWFYIQNAHGGLFDNVAMYDKYLHSSVAADVSTQLKNVDKYNYVGHDKKKGAINNKFLRLSRHIHRAIVYADSDIRLTDLAICITSEYVGRTIRDIPNLVANKDFLPGLDLVFTDYEIFTKHMFEFVYAFYCMNTKIGIIHGDLHMNNATINRVYTMMSFDGTSYIKNPIIVYLVDGTAYSFRHAGLFSTIIDFSRSIIGDKTRLVNEFGERFADQYFMDQRNRILNMIYHYFPVLIEKHLEAVTTLLTDKFPLMFKILTATDTFVIMGNIAAMFSIDDVFTQGRVKIADGVMALLDRLTKMSEKLVLSNIIRAIDGKITKPDDIEWPNLLIIRELFKDNILNKKTRADKTINVVEIFNSSNDVIDDIEDYDTWGPMLTIEAEQELWKQHKPQNSNMQVNEWLDIKNIDDSEILNKLTSKYEKQEGDSLEFEPWMTLL